MGPRTRVTCQRKIPSITGHQLHWGGSSHLSPLPVHHPITPSATRVAIKKSQKHTYLFVFWFSACVFIFFWFTLRFHACSPNLLLNSSHKIALTVDRQNGPRIPNRFVRRVGADPSPAERATHIPLRQGLCIIVSMYIILFSGFPSWISISRSSSSLPGLASCQLPALGPDPSKKHRESKDILWRIIYMVIIHIDHKPNGPYIACITISNQKSYESYITNHMNIEAYISQIELIM